MKAQITDFITKTKNNIQGEIHSDTLHLHLYSTDASDYQILPIAILYPKSVDDVKKSVQYAYQYKIPIISRGGGSSLSGQSIGKGLVIDYTRYMNKILLIDHEQYQIKVQSGTVLNKINKHLRTKGQMIGPDPSSAKVASIGGMIANNTTGAHSIVYGHMIDHIISLEVILPNGELITCDKKSTEEITQICNQNTREASLYKEVISILETYKQQILNDYPKTWRNVAGYNLNKLLKTYENDGSLNLAHLITGSEGTLGSIVSATIKTVAIPKMTRLALIHFSDMVTGCEAVPHLLETTPTAIELSNDYFIQLVAGNPTYNTIQQEFVKGMPKILLIVEYSADTSKELDTKITIMYDKLKEIGHHEEIVIRTTPKEIADVWLLRKAGFGLLMSKRGDARPISMADDATVPVEYLSKFLPRIHELFKQKGIKEVMIGHASAGCVHINPNVNLKTEEGITQMQDISTQIATIAMEYNGTTSGEHGEGIAKSYFNEQLHGTKLYEAFKKVKSTFDPEHLLQPGIIINPPKPWDTKLLRFNPNYKIPLNPTKNILDFSKDGGFSGMVEMCNGMGFCRSEDDGGVMCPSYRVTKDERHSTRGRANVLRAAIKGEIPKGLSDKEVYETLDLCLECKACKTECPSMVDMAKLKYEYLYQYQLKNGFKLKNKVFGYIHTFNKVSKPIAGIVNFFFKHPLFKIVLEKTLNIDRRRNFPTLSTEESFQKWFKKRSKKETTTDKEIILWDDTYITFYNPEIGKAAVYIFETLNYKVTILSKRVCCGRPLISKGLLNAAKKAAENNVALLAPYAKKGIPIIGLEPSCIATFKDEYPDLLTNEDAKIVADKSYFYEDFLIDILKDMDLNNLQELSNINTIKIHNHCYQKALGKPQNTIKLLQHIPNTKVEEIRSGCCGMAGSFGYEKNHYEISMASGEERLFPAIRNSNPNTCIAASGISCRHQIKDGTNSKALHPIEIFAKALKSNDKTL